MHPRSRWRALAARDLSRMGFSDQQVVFHRPSGKTHFLNNTACTLLELVSEQLLDETGLARALAERHPELEALDSSRLEAGHGSSSVLSEHVRGILLRFEELGLVRPAPV
jgi:PqqD family protein of HPr-rel-A system